MRYKRKVLIAPAHYLLDDLSHGSEYAWPVGLMRACAARGDVEFVAIAGAVGANVSIPGVRLISLGLNVADSASIVGVTRFVVGYARTATHVIKTWAPDVIHHLLPFRTGATFNPVILMRPSARTVVGPVQGSHRVSLDDEGGVAVGEYTASVHGPQRLRRVGWRVAQVVARHFCRLTLARADCVLAVNDLGAHAARSAGAVRPKVVPFGVDTERFVPVPSAITRSGEFTFLVVAYLMARKRVKDVIEAFAIVATRNPRVRLRIVGDGPERVTLVALVQGLGVGDRCEFVGRVPQEKVCAEYHRADVLVSASASETYGMAILEAMACGLPVIASRNDGSAQIVEDGHTGYLYAIGEVNELAKKMIQLCEAPEVVRMMGEASLASVDGKYAWKSVAFRIMSVYADLSN